LPVTRRPLATRRSILATAAGLAATAAAGKSARAQFDDLPDATDGLEKFAPQPAPPVVFTDAHGSRLTLRDFPGHALVVNLWATWCGPCVAELPSFAAIAPRLQSSGVLILPISIDLSGATAVRPFYASHNITTLPILLDQNGTNMAVLDTDSIPLTVVINSSGHMIARMDGAANWNTPGTLAFLQSLDAAPPPSHTGFIPV
jgi:thiol-disulfide isomerase/thioredoxin